jgi:hypothetical protein
MKQRLKNALLALLAAWTVATLATLPVQISVCLRNSEGDMHLFRQLLPLVLMIWSFWTAGLSIAGWLIVALPFALLVNPAWIYLKRSWFVLAGVLAPILFTTMYFEAWRVLRSKHEPIDKHSYMLYSAFTVCYAATMAATYTWLAGRSERSGA